MATQRSRLQQQFLHAGNVAFNKQLPTDPRIAPNVAPAARNGLGPVKPNTPGTPPNPGMVRDLERASLFAQIQKAMKITRFQG